MEDPVARQKAPLRQQMRAVRRDLSPQARRAASAAICDRLRRLPELAGVRRVLGYCAMAEEADIAPALRALHEQGVQVVLPWVVDEERLGLTVVGDLAHDVAPGWRGLAEPIEDVRRPIAAQTLDAVLAPGLAFDAAGNRLGHGGGHFDRLLARLRRGAAIIGVAFDEQIVDHVPVAPHDRSMTLVVTPSRTLRASR